MQRAMRARIFAPPRTAHSARGLNARFFLLFRFFPSLFSLRAKEEAKSKNGKDCAHTLSWARFLQRVLANMPAAARDFFPFICGYGFVLNMRGRPQGAYNVSMYCSRSLRSSSESFDVTPCLSFLLNFFIISNIDFALPSYR